MEVVHLERRPRLGERVVTFFLRVFGTITLPLVAVLALLTYRSVFLVWVGIGAAAWFMISRVGIGISFLAWFALYFAITWLLAILVCVVHDHGFAKL